MMNDGYPSAHLVEEARPFVAREMIIDAALVLTRADTLVESVQNLEQTAVRLGIGREPAGDPFNVALVVARRALGEAVDELRTMADHAIPYLRDLDDTRHSYRAALDAEGRSGWATT